MLQVIQDFAVSIALRGQVDGGTSVRIRDKHIQKVVNVSGREELVSKEDRNGLESIFSAGGRRHSCLISKATTFL